MCLRERVYMCVGVCVCVCMCVFVCVWVGEWVGWVVVSNFSFKHHFDRILHEQALKRYAPTPESLSGNNCATIFCMCMSAY